MHAEYPNFLRSQDHLSVWNPRGTGRVYSYREALAAFGQAIIDETILEGVVALTQSHDEPSKTIRERRESLGFSIAELSKYTNIEQKKIIAAEDPNLISKIRDLERICVALNLDEKRIGYMPPSESDNSASLRFKDLLEKRYTKKSNSRFILNEALWIMAKVDSLRSAEDQTAQEILIDWCNDELIRVSQRYEKPYQQGAQLAKSLRKKLGLAKDEPIESTLDIWENKFKVHVINAAISEPISAMTIYSTGKTGIIVNRRNDISSKIRRFASAHEICHFLFDGKDDNFEAKVENLDIERGTSDLGAIDDCERRANGFAIEFLCPLEAVKSTYLRLKTENHWNQSLTDDNLARLSTNIAESYGLSISATLSHVMNSLGIDRERYREIRRSTHKYETSANSYWDNSEMGYRIFISEYVGFAKAGYFTRLVLASLDYGEISEDTALSYLGLDSREKLSAIASYIV